jgi:signal transduction histidine kinase
MAERSPKHIPMEVYLLCDIASGSAHLIRTRWVVGALVLAATAFATRMLGLDLQEEALYFTGAFVLLFNGVLVWVTRRAYTPDAMCCLVRTRWIVALQVVVDWASLTVLVHLTGGVCSPATLFMLAHVLTVSTLLPDWAPYFAALGVGMLALLMVLEATGVLFHYTIIPALPPDLCTNPIMVGSQILSIAIMALAIIYLTTSTWARLRGRERRIAILLETIQAASSTFDLPRVLEHLTRSVAEALMMPSASIHLLDETGEVMTVAAAHGLSQEYLDKRPVELSKSDLDSEVMTEGPVIVHATDGDSPVRFPEQAAREGFQSVLAVPITGRGTPLGVLRVYSQQLYRFTVPDVDFVSTIARQGATALEDALAYESLRKADEERAQFVRMVTHELRAPVGGAQSLLRTLLRGLAGELSEQQHDLLARLEVRLDHLLTLINDLLAMAASRTVDLEQPLKRVPLQPILQQVADRLNHEAESKDVTLSVDAPFEVLTVLATEEGLARVLGNLIGNAIKYTPSGGKVWVKVVERPSGVVVTVSDTGIGIPEDCLPNLWREFYRARNARQSGVVGTGLGLSIVKQLVDHFGGMISVRSKEGKGSTFKLTLQRAGPGDDAL